jgi:hypothetical protein
MPARHSCGWRAALQATPAHRAPLAEASAPVRPRQADARARTRSTRSTCPAAHDPCAQRCTRAQPPALCEAASRASRRVCACPAPPRRTRPPFTSCVRRSAGRRARRRIRTRTPRACTARCCIPGEPPRPHTRRAAAAQCASQHAPAAAACARDAARAHALQNSQETPTLPGTHKAPDAREDGARGARRRRRRARSENAPLAPAARARRRRQARPPAASVAGTLLRPRATPPPHRRAPPAPTARAA